MQDADIKHTKEADYYPLHIAALHGHLSIVELLLSKRGGVNQG